MNNLIITGSPRSGTTALRVVLSEHPDIHIYDEMGLFKPEGLKARIKVLIGKASEWINRYNSHLSIPIEELLMKSDSDMILRNNIMNASTSKYYGDKFHSEYLTVTDKIDKVHKPLWIVCIRDPRGVIASQYRKGINTEENWKINDPAQGGKFWLESMEAWIKFRDSIPENRKVEVKYEEDSLLIRHKVIEILDKADISHTPEIVEHMIETYKPTNVNAWKDELANFEIDDKFKPAMETLGYL